MEMIKDLAGFPLANDLKMNLQGRNTVVGVSNFYVVSSQLLQDL